MQTIHSKAPARICLFGDHQDYMQLPIIACAINKYIEIEAVPNGKNLLHVFKHDLNTEQKIPLPSIFENLELDDYLQIGMKVLARYNCIATSGYDIHIRGDVPINAGLSSSTALTIAWIQFFIEAFGIDGESSPIRIAQLAYETEVVERGSSGGKMDQFTIALADTIYLETDTDHVETIDKNIESLIVGVSGLSKDTFGTLKKLKSDAWKAIEQVKNKFPNFNIKTADSRKLSEYLSCVDSDLIPVFEAAMGNYEITQKANRALREDKYKLEYIGELMNAHHIFLRDNLGITVPRIDAMIDAALLAGAYGAKIVGSGGGGCIVVLAPKSIEQDIIASIKTAGAVDAFVVQQT